MTTSRERKAEWIRSFGISALENAVSEIIAIDGHHFLTDDQLEQIVSKMAADERIRRRRMIRNRNAVRAHAGLPPIYSAADFHGEPPALRSALAAAE